MTTFRYRCEMPIFKARNELRESNVHQAEPRNIFPHALSIEQLRLQHGLALCEDSVAVAICWCIFLYLLFISKIEPGKHLLLAKESGWQRHYHLCLISCGCGGGLWPNARLAD